MLLEDKVLTQGHSKWFIPALCGKRSYKMVPEQVFPDKERIHSGHMSSDESVPMATLIL